MLFHPGINRRIALDRAIESQQFRFSSLHFIVSFTRLSTSHKKEHSHAYRVPPNKKDGRALPVRRVPSKVTS